MKAKILYCTLFSLALFICGCGGDDDNPAAAENSTVSYGGKTYHTVVIGSQTWLKENLDIGTMIETNYNQENNGTIEKYCYNNDPNNCVQFGGLYKWTEAMAYSITEGAKGICPEGYHIPTWAQLQTLTASVANSSNALKSVGQGTGEGAGTNTSGFSALLAGVVNDNAISYFLNAFTYYWSSTTVGYDHAYVPIINDYNNSIGTIASTLNLGLSIRCIKD